MNRDDIIRMAMDAGLRGIAEGEMEVEGSMFDFLGNFAALVAAAEREACAKVCDAYGMPDGTSHTAAGDVLVADMTDPDWEPVMKRAADEVWHDLEYVRAEDYDALAAEVTKLRADAEILRAAGIVEVSIRNASVREYMLHWETRTRNAEVEVEKLRADAERYRWLRSNVQFWEWMATHGSDASFDAAIDAAREVKQHCKKCGGLMKPGLHWQMFMVIYCKVCKRIWW